MSWPNQCARCRPWFSGAHRIKMRTRNPDVIVSAVTTLVMRAVANTITTKVSAIAAKSNHRSAPHPGTYIDASAICFPYDLPAALGFGS